MIEQVEISGFDLRYEGYRLKNPKEEKSLLTSILEHGIREPLQGVDSDPLPNRILLNGFKRYRCAQKLKIAMVPYHSLGNDEAFGIITLLRISNSKQLNILEQAKLIDELQKVYKMSIPQIKRADRKEVDPQLLCHLWKKCDGGIQRIHEILIEEEDIQVGYSTLTRLLRELDPGQKKKKRTVHVEDIPGQEMQHDTSPYRLIIGNRQVQVVASLLYFRYSKMRYLKFYR